MRSAAAVARRSHALRAAEFSNLCWSCLVAQRRQLSITSSPRLSRAIPFSNNQFPPEKLRTPALRQSFHSSTRSRQQAVTTSHSSPQPLGLGTTANLTTKEYLQRWQEKFGTPNKELLDELGIEANTGTLSENSARLISPDDLRDLKRSEDDPDEDQTLAYGDHEDLLDEELSGQFMKRGDLVELQFASDREPMIAVFIQQFNQQGQFYSSNGKWFHRAVKDIQFTVPGYVDPSLLDPILPFLPKSEVTAELLETMQTLDVNAPREVAGHVLRRLRTFAEEADTAYRRHASALDRAHRTLAHATDLRFGSLQKIAETLLGTQNPPLSTMYAVRRALLRQSMGFIVDSRSHRQTSVFQIIPLELKERMELAQSWIRDFQDETARLSSSPHNHVISKELKGAANVRMFIQKARKLIDRSRTMRDFTPYGRVGISRERHQITPDSGAMREIQSLNFGDSDIVLIRFMEAWSIMRLFLLSPRIASLPPVLLRATGRYPDQTLDNSIGQVFLQEIGVIPPHENRMKYDPNLLLPTASHSRSLEIMYKKVVKTFETSRKEVREKDSMRDLRKDWQGMPVYCVDSPSAEEIDDGVSIERIADTSEYWVHVHIANPTAFLSRTDLISKMAAHLTESIYMPERTYSMLPKWISLELLSLGPNRPCLTISMRLNERAEILEDKIQPGYIRVFVPITPQTLHKVVDEEAAKAAEAERDITIVVGGEVPPLPTREMKEVSDLSHKHVADLRLLHQLALERQKRRTEAGGIFFNQNYPDMSVYADYNRPGLPRMNPSHRRARYIEGDPVIKLEATPTRSWFEPAGSGNDLMVREMMLLAGEVTALWCKKRNVPIIYRGTVAHPDMMSIADYKEKVMLPSLDGHGQPPVVVAFNYLPHAGSSISSTTPRHHQVLGVPQYAKVTSPLRRFGDMLVHWQIESALRKEAVLGCSLIGEPADSLGTKWLAFRPAEVESIIQRLAPRERLISKTKRQAQAFWLTQLFFRAFYYGEAVLPTSFEVVVFSKPDERLRRIPVLWQDYSFDLDMNFPHLYGIADEVRIGDRWEVRIVEADCFNRRVKTEPLRLISREHVPVEFDFMRR